MPTVKMDINTGIEYSPTSGLDSSVKLHNFIVGTDGSLYKMCVLKIGGHYFTHYVLVTSSCPKGHGMRKVGFQHLTPRPQALNLLSRCDLFILPH